ncbi:hypothetical protein TYRP_022572 [Tyrophagus putrescentiae]|nr:hypothetical protein TYRP_022572 [Tyrophagus putrescentiae]
MGVLQFSAPAQRQQQAIAALCCVSRSPANPGQPPPSEASLTDLVGISLLDDRAQQIIANFVANHWRGVSPPVNGPVAPSMLKLFEGEYQLEAYRKLVINRLQFHHNRDARFLLNRGEQQHFWRHQDHLCLSAFTNTPIDVLISALVALFDTPERGGGGRITALVVGTCSLPHLSLVDLLKAFQPSGGGAGRAGL